MTKLIIFLIGLLIPSSKPCLPFVALAKEGPTTNSAIQCLQSLPQLEPKLKFANYFLRKPQISTALNLLDETKPFLLHLDYLLGQDKPTTYVILLQNNNEMRANGGFFGSYVVVTLDKASPSFRFQDIYVPDGALIGHVDPPAPIQTAFQQGWFRLRDSDWEPDFVTTSQTIRWFLEKGGEINPDMLITLNLSTIEKIIHTVGEIDVPEYNFKLNSDNLYSLLQNQAEIGFFPGSTQKQDVLSAVGRVVIKKLGQLQPEEYLQISQILLDQLHHENLLVNSTNPNLQKIIAAKNWAGKLTMPSCSHDNCLNDTVLLIETNMGANKANCCVNHTTEHIITRSTPNEAKGEVGSITHLINLTFQNNSPLENPLPPRFYGGNYISYLRFYLPPNATHIRLTAQPTLPKTLLQYPTPFDGLNNQTFSLKDNYGLREVGFFHLTAAGTKSAVQLSYDLPLDNNPTSYQLNLLKQHGLESSPQEINLFGKSTSTNLNTNYSFFSSL